jgi:hypothetical protein
VWSLLKFFALTFAATWTCFIAAVAISHGSASTDPRLEVIRGLVSVGTFAPALVALMLTAGAGAISETKHSSVVCSSGEWVHAGISLPSAIWRQSSSQSRSRIAS